MTTQGLHQVQRQTQALILAPQLRQSLKILQVPALELRNTILEELQTNPALEELPMDGISLEANENSDELPEREATERELDFENDNEILFRLTEDMREYFAQENSAVPYNSDQADRRQYFFDSITMETSLQEHLIQQANLSDADPEVVGALEYLVGSLDDRGFLTMSPEEIVDTSQLPFHLIEEALDLLKRLDPPGIGSANLQECLLTQLNLGESPSPLARSILQNHFDLLLRRRIPEIARKLGAQSAEVQAAIEEIAALDPAPGRKFGEDSNRIVVPDVKVEKDADQWIVTLNNDYIPKLRLSGTYKQLIAKGTLSKKEREYIHEKIRSGKFLISSIEQRQQTLERITREILHFQIGFFEHGISKLKPLTMSQVAERVGVHETTISRAISSKYIDTPHGVFALKFFFTTGYVAHNGEEVSNTSIKELIAQIIEKEDSTKPLSDQEIVNILSKRDIKIARRTVAKYRVGLGILPTNLRRQY